MTGRVDESGRALLAVRARASASAPQVTFDAWIDTGFNGHLVLPRTLIASLGLPIGFATQAVLADGSEIELDCHRGQLEWFGAWWAVQVVVGDGPFPLLGVGLLLGHDLHIDYTRMTLTLD